jgi:hypothetical protein
MFHIAAWLALAHHPYLTRKWVHKIAKKYLPDAKTDGQHDAILGFCIHALAAKL